MALLKTLTDKLRNKQSAKEEKEPALSKYKEARLPKTSTDGLYSFVLKKAHVTEKSTRGVTNCQYVFNVARRANKAEIKKAVLAIYGIKPISVNCIRVKGKNVLVGKLSGKKKDVKKAIVTLPKGKTISLYEGV